MTVVISIISGSFRKIHRKTILMETYSGKVAGVEKLLELRSFLLKLLDPESLLKIRILQNIEDPKPLPSWKNTDDILSKQKNLKFRRYSCGSSHCITRLKLAT